MNKEPELIIPDSIDTARDALDFRPWELCIFIPYPNADGGFYVNQADIVALLRANKNDPDAIQYIADMME